MTSFNFLENFVKLPLMINDHEDPFKKSHCVPGIVYQLKRLPGGHSFFPYASEGISELLAITTKEAQEDAIHAFNRVHPADLEELQRALEESARTMQEWKYECRINHPLKGIRWVKGIARPESLPDGSIIWHGYVNDFTERKLIEEELLDKNRLLAISQKINGMIVHSKTNEDIYKSVCEIVTSLGQFKLAWIGIFDPETSRLVPVAQSGTEVKYLEEIPPIIVNDGAVSKGPSGIAFSEKRTVINNDLPHNPNYAPWRGIALKHGFHSSIALPMIVRNEVIGTFNIYSSQLNYFTQDEVVILEDLTRNMSFAIGVLEDRKLLAKSELDFRTIFDKAPMGILLADTQTGEIYQINDRFLELLGQKRATFKHRNWMEFTHPDDLPRNERSKKLLAEGKVPGYKTTKRYLRPDNSVVWVDILVVPFGPGEDRKPRNLVMVQDITDRIMFEDQLHKAIAIKDEFFAIASHELKTPTTSVKLQLQMLKRGITPEKRQDPLIGKIIQGIDKTLGQVDRLVELVNNLMDVVNFRRGKLSISMGEVDLSEILKEAIQKSDVLFREKGCEVCSEIEPDLIGMFDRTRIEQVFFNLMDNATKYAPGAPINIVLRRKEHRACFIITDHGPGIENKKLDKIFDRFERLGADRNYGGLGLGLYIVKNIIEAHDGHISVESTVGTGTTFTVVLPLSI